MQGGEDHLQLWVLYPGHRVAKCLGRFENLETVVLTWAKNTDANFFLVRVSYTTDI